MDWGLPLCADGDERRVQGGGRAHGGVGSIQRSDGTRLSNDSFPSDVFLASRHRHEHLSEGRGKGRRIPYSSWTNV